MAELCPHWDTLANGSKTSSGGFTTRFHPSRHLGSGLMASIDSVDSDGQVPRHPAGAWNRAGPGKEMALVKCGGANDSPQDVGLGSETVQPTPTMQALRTFPKGEWGSLHRPQRCPPQPPTPTPHKPRKSSSNVCAFLYLPKKPKLENRELEKDLVAERDASGKQDGMLFPVLKPPPWGPSSQ